MESFDFIESGIIFGLQTAKDLKQFRYPSADFATHGEAYTFIVRYFDDYGDVPSAEVLAENFPTLDTAAQTLDLGYAVDSFKKQLLYRQVVNTFQQNKSLLQDNPKRAYSLIMSGLNDIGIVYDEDVISYDKTAEARLQEWKDKRLVRMTDGGMLGIKTSLDTVNNTGVGWMPGELISVFARPAVGKTWFCVESAVEAAFNGVKTLLISTEMPEAQISLRADVIFANKMGYEFSHRALRNGEDIDEDKYREFLLQLNGRPLLICDHISGQTSMSIDALASLIRKHSPDFVVIDGSYLINSGAGRNKQAWEESHTLFYALKNLATSSNLSMMVSTQANRSAADVFTPPQPDQVAFGDALLRASDVLLSMCMVQNEPLRRIVQYQKYRDAESFANASVLDWNPDIGLVKEIYPDY